MKNCPSGKRIYVSQTLAEDALIDAWIRSAHKPGNGPVNVYLCEDCGNFHFTSKGNMNTRLKAELDSGQIARGRRAFEHESKFRHR